MSYREVKRDDSGGKGAALVAIPLFSYLRFFGRLTCLSLSDQAGQFQRVVNDYPVNKGFSHLESASYIESLPILTVLFAISHVQSAKRKVIEQLAYLCGTEKAIALQ